MRGRKKKEKGMLQGLKSRKRKKFGTVFLQRWLIVMLVVALLYGEGLAVFVTYQKWECKKAFSYAASRQSEYSIFMSSDYTEQEILNYLDFQLALDITRYNTFSYIYDEDTMDILAGCEEKMFLLQMKEMGDNIRVLTCETSDIKGWDSYRQQILEDYKPFRRIYELFHSNFIYTDGTRFIPVDLTMEAVASDVGAYFLGTNKGINDLPVIALSGTKNIPEGYDHEYIGGAWLGSCQVAGYSPASPTSYYNKSHEDSYALLNTLYKGLQNGTKVWNLGGEFVYQEHFFDIQMGRSLKSILPNGREVILLQATSLDVWKNYGSVLLGIGLGVFVLGTLLAILLALVSYTRLKAAYALEDYRKNITNTMAHDLKSPLMSISGYAENLRDHLNTEKQTYYSQAILNGVQYMNGIIESVLYLSKMEEGKLTLKKESLQVRKVVEKLEAEREENLQERGLKVEMAGDVVLEADATLLEQLLCNLMDNAVKYASKDTTICVMMKDKEISIQNVCEEDLQGVADTLCQPFVVGDTSRSNRKGSGLGLAIARNICELHGFGFELICKEKSFEAKIKG